MTKQFLIALLFLFPVLLCAQQDADTLVMSQINSLFQTAQTLAEAGQLTSALDANAQAQELARGTQRAQSAIYASLCNQRSTILYYRGQPGDREEAKAENGKAVRIAREVLGADAPELGQYLNDQGALHFTLGEFEESKVAFEEALAITGKVEGKQSVSYAVRLAGLAAIYERSGQYDAAEKNYQEAIAIIAPMANEETVTYLTLLSNLAHLYKTIGRPDKGIPLMLEVLPLAERSVTRSSPNFCLFLNNLAEFYENVGQYQKSEELFREALENAERTVTKRHSSYSLISNNFALLYARMGRLDEAIALFEDALQMMRDLNAFQYSEYGVRAHNLGKVYHIKGDYAAAKPLYEEALKNAEQAEGIGKGHLYHSSFLASLANLARDEGEYTKADSLYAEVVSALKSQQFDKSHRMYTAVLKEWGRLKWLQGDWPAVAELYAEADTLQQSVLRREGRYLTERDLQMYAETFTEWLSTMYSFAHQHAKDVPYMRGMAFDATLFHKGFVLQNVRQLRAKDGAEGDGMAASTQVLWGEVSRALQPNEAAIEFVHYQLMMPAATDTIMYAALVLLPGQDSPSFVPLCEEQQLVALLQGGGSDRAVFHDRVYRGEDRFTPVQDIRDTSLLYSLIWKPLAAMLQKVDTIYFSPSGLLNRLNLAAIRVDSTHRLDDRHHLIAMGSTRQLAQKVPARPVQMGELAVVFGGINYGDGAGKAPDADVFHPFGFLRGGAWNELQGAQKEARSLCAIFDQAQMPYKLFDGTNATEEAYKVEVVSGQCSPRILHLATHGFFSPDPQKAGRSSLLTPAYLWTDNPMNRSGLALAGGNYARVHGHAPEGRLEDGILTAEEVSQMYLRHTELVVLSACETGLGDIQGNEGVYGLQRAFKIAGAQYLIMSLWRVPDEETAEFMEKFYKYWLEGKLPIRNAFREAQREMRRKYEGKPHKWAAFVLVE